MSIKDEQFKKILKLARIKFFSQEESDKMRDLLNKEIDSISDDIFNVDTTNLEGMVNPYDIKLETYEDVVSDGNKADEIMKTAPKIMYNFFAVPKVIE